jgi:WD40 repeat protein
LFAYNPIYTRVFDKQWVKKCLMELRPSHYAEAIQAWFENNKQESYLLREKALGDVETWAKGKQLSAEDEEFLQECRVQDKWEADRKLKVAEEANQILINAKNNARKTSIGVVLILSSIIVIAVLISGQELNRLHLNGDIADANLDFSEHKDISTLLKIVKAAQKFKTIPSILPKYNETKSELFLSLQRIVYGTWEKNRLIGHKGRVNSVAFSPDGQIIASGSDDKTIKLWNKNGGLLTTILAHDDEITSVVFSEDGQMIASSSDDRTVKTWNLKGEQLQIFKKDPKVPLEKKLKINTKSFTSPEKKCRKSSDDNAGHADKVLSIAFSPTEKKIASASCDTTIKLWNLDGKLLQTFKGHQKRVNSVVFHPKGQSLLSGSLDNNVILWDLSGKILNKLRGVDINSVAFSPDGKLLVVGNGDGQIQQWEVLKNKIVPLKTFVGHSDAVRSLSFSKDGEKLISSSKDRTIKIWDLKGRQASNDFFVSPVIRTIEGHTEEVKKVIFSPDEKIIASASADREIRLWRTDSKFYNASKDFPEQHKTEAKRAVYKQASFVSNDQIIAFDPIKKTIETWDLDHKLLHSFLISTDRIVDLAFSPNKKKIVFTGLDSAVKILDLNIKKLPIILSHNQQVTSLAVSSNGEMIASYSLDDNILKVWNWEGQLLQTISRCDDVSSIHKMAFSPDGKKLAMSSKYEATLILWDLDDRECKSMKKFDGHRKRIESITFSQNGKMIATGSQDKTIKIWDLRKEEDSLPKNIQGHDHWITSLAFSPDGKALVSGSRDNSVKVWSAQKARIVYELPSHNGFVNSVAFSPDGSKIISSGDDGVLKIWRYNIDQSLKDGCELVTGYLTNIKDKSKENGEILKACEEANK